MNQSEKPKFEQEWQQAFESAAETPPPAIWDAIEKRLDGEEAIVVPLLWWKNPKVWYAAAAVAALLLVSWPILQLADKQSTKQSAQLANQTPSPSNPASPTNGTSSESSTLYAPDIQSPGVVSHANERMATTEASRNAPSVSPSSALTESSERIPIEASRQPDLTIAQNPVAVGDRSISESTGLSLLTGESKNTRVVSTTEPRLPEQREAFLNSAPTIIAITQTTRKIPTGADASGDLERVITGSSTVPLRTPALTQSIAALSPVDDLTWLGVYLRKPAVRSDLAVLETDAIARPKRSRVREFWAGLGLMPAAFNPRMNVTSAPAAFANANAGRQSLSNANQAQLSYAVQAQAGKQLSKHWSVETGVSYLQGNSTFESGGYVLDAVTSQSANVLEDALYSNSGYNNYAAAPSLTTNFDKSAGLYIDFEQRTSNDYRYVQLPVQAGYTLNPDGKLNYTMLGGVVANLFLQNEIKNKAGYVFANTADDGLYRALNWSAATGVRVNYRLGDHWNASLTGSYQKAIASILKGDSVLDSRPQLYGMSWGVRYVF